MGLIDDKSFFGIWKRDTIKTERDFSAFYLRFLKEFNYTPTGGCSAEGNGADRIGQFVFDWKYFDNQLRIEFQKKYREGGIKPFYRGVYVPEVQGYTGEWDLGRDGDVKEGSFILVPWSVMEKIEAKDKSTKKIEEIITRQLLENEFQLLASAVGGIRNQFPFAPPF